MPRLVSLVAAGVLACGSISMLTAQEMVLRDFTQPSARADSAGPDFWTAERRAAALPLMPSISGRALAGPTAPTGPIVTSAGRLPGIQDAPMDRAPDQGSDAAIVAPQEAGVFATYPYPFTRFHPWGGLYNGAYAFWPVMPYRTVGKLFFQFGTSSYVCSAAVIRPHLLLTARHCLLDASAGWARNVVFFPGYFNGSANPKLKAWTARRMGTWSYSGSGASFKWDIGFIQTYDDDNSGCGRSGHAIEWFTGYLGWMYGGSVLDRNYTSLGYPQAAPFNGLFMVEARSDVGNVDPLSQTGTFSMGNDMTGGSSGGPWIVGFGTSNYVNGLNSYKWVTPARPLEMNSPNFQADNFANLLTWVQSWTCP